MLWLADVYVGRLVALLRERQMWDNTLLVFSSDNGGHVDGINYPYRGEKRTNYTPNFKSRSRSHKMRPTFKRDLYLA